MKKLAFYLLMISLFGIGMTSCSEENNGPDTPEVPQEDSVYVEDELAILQNHLVKVDEEGNLVERIWGEVLDEAAPDEVTVGVDSLAEAVTIFRGFFAGTTMISEDGMLATFSVKEGSAELKAANGENGLVAYATFDVPGLMYVSRINFILNSAWPENATAKGYHKLGGFYEHTGWTGNHDSQFDRYEFFKYMCIREYNNGKPALLFAVCSTPYQLSWRSMDEYGGNMPNEAKAKEISSILRKDWANYKKRVNEVYGRTALENGWQYWIYGGSDYVFVIFVDCITLSTGDMDYYEVHNTSKKLATLFYMESCQKM